MYLLYVDESGQHGGDYFVLAGVAVFDLQANWLGESIDQIQQRYLPELQEPAHFHASEIRVGRREPWKQLPQQQRRDLLDEVYSRIVDSSCTLFGIALERRWLQPQDDEYAYALESLLARFDRFLKRVYREQNKPQRGLVIVAESQFRQRLETLALRVRREGTRWGELYNLAEVPLFTLAENSRLPQVADFCANAIWGRYESGQTRQFDKIVRRFDAEDAVIHGLAHFCVDHQQCHCPACLTRRLRAQTPDL